MKYSFLKICNIFNKYFPVFHYFVYNTLISWFQLSFFQCRADDKMAILLYLLKTVMKRKEQTVVFAATKHHVEYIHMVCYP